MPAMGGIVLCGGGSRRMGRDKVWLPLGDQPLLARVVNCVRTAVSPAVVVGRRNQCLPPLPTDVRVVHDEVPDHGPLAGIAAGMAALEGTCDAVVVIACDHALIRPGFIRRLVELLDDHNGVVPYVGDRLYPLCGVYRLTELPLIRTMLDRGELRACELPLRCAARQATAAELTPVDSDLQSLRNINGPDDYRRLTPDA